MKFTSMFALVAGLGVFAGSAIGQGRIAKPTTFTGTWTCVTCNPAQTTNFRDYYSHDYGLVLDNGEYIMFLDTPEALTLIKGNGNVPTKIEVTGTYYTPSRSIRVQSYSITGIEYTWCGDHNQMDPCDQRKLVKVPDSE